MELKVGNEKSQFVIESQEYVPVVHVFVPTKGDMPGTEKWGKGIKDEREARALANVLKSAVEANLLQIQRDFDRRRKEVK